MSHDLPEGIWYEEERDRYRVRIYRKSRVIWLTYHTDLGDAIEALGRALRKQQWLRSYDSLTIDEANMVEALAMDMI